MQIIIKVEQCVRSKLLNANMFIQEYLFARVQILKAYKETLFIKHLKNNIRHLETRTGVSYVFCFKFTPLMNTYFLTICRNAYYNNWGNLKPCVLANW